MSRPFLGFLIRTRPGPPALWPGAGHGRRMWWQKSLHRRPGARVPAEQGDNGRQPRHVRDDLAADARMPVPHYNESLDDTVYGPAGTSTCAALVPVGAPDPARLKEIMLRWCPRRRPEPFVG